MTGVRHCAVENWKEGARGRRASPTVTRSLCRGSVRSRVAEEEWRWSVKGSCNCGDVGYSAGNAVNAVVNCHCNLCRKMNGSTFSTYVVVPDEEFEPIRGELNSVKVSHNATKSFCSRCGTPIYNKNPKFGGLKILYLGSIDSEVSSQAQFNIYCESRLSWVMQRASIRSFDQGAVPG